MSDEGNMELRGGGASFTTDPAAGSSSATDVSLREYVAALIAAAEERNLMRINHLKAMVDTSFQSAQIAIAKAEIATEKRFESVNEFRAALTDQANHFITRDTMEALSDKLSTQIARNREDIVALSGDDGNLPRPVFDAFVETYRLDQERFVTERRNADDKLSSITKNLHDQIITERGDFLTQEVYDQRHQALVQQVNAVQAWQYKLVGGLVFATFVGPLVTAMIVYVFTHHGFG